MTQQHDDVKWSKWEKKTQSHRMKLELLGKVTRIDKHGGDFLTFGEKDQVHSAPVTYSYADPRGEKAESIKIGERHQGIFFSHLLHLTQIWTSGVPYL